MPERAEFQVEFFDLIKAREKISTIQKPVRLINAPGTIRSLGALAIDKIFRKLMNEFIVTSCTFRVDDDLAGLFQALKLGYKDILYTGNLEAVKRILRNHKN
jgi:hypothetical protein